MNLLVPSFPSPLFWKLLHWIPLVSVDKDYLSSCKGQGTTCSKSCSNFLYFLLPLFCPMYVYSWCQMRQWPTVSADRDPRILKDSKIIASKGRHNRLRTSFPLPSHLLPRQHHIIYSLLTASIETHQHWSSPSHQWSNHSTIATIASLQPFSVFLLAITWFPST